MSLRCFVRVHDKLVSHVVRSRAKIKSDGWLEIVGDEQIRLAMGDARNLLFENGRLARKPSARLRASKRTILPDGSDTSEITVEGLPAAMQRVRLVVNGQAVEIGADETLEIVSSQEGTIRVALDEPLLLCDPVTIVVDEGDES